VSPLLKSDSLTHLALCQDCFSKVPQLHCRCAASLNALSYHRDSNRQSSQQDESSGCSESNVGSGKQCTQVGMLRRAWYHTDSALMSGCPYNLVAPIVQFLELFRVISASGDDLLKSVHTHRLHCCVPVQTAPWTRVQQFECQCECRRAAFASGL
jgi:hypothetical protein